MLKPLIKVPIKLGLVGSGMLILMFFLFYFTDSNPLLELPIFSIFVLPVFIFFLIKEYRTYNQKLLKFQEGMTTEFVIYFSIALIYSLFLLLILTLLDLELIQEFISLKLAALRGEGTEID